MKNYERKATGGSAGTPPYWSSAANSRGETTLTYAVRGGNARVVLAMLGTAAVAGGLGFIFWMVGGGELTIAGMVLTIAVGGTLLVFGAHCLDTVFLAKSEYLLGKFAFIACRSSMWGRKRTEIPRSAVTGVAQHYFPPDSSSATGNPGTWTTFLVSRKKTGKGSDELAFDGMRSPEEARWLGPLVAEWAGVAVRREFGSGFEEADEKEMPSLDE